MKPLAFGRKRLALFFCIAVCVAGLIFWLVFIGKGRELPEEKLAAQRLSTAIALGWGWLHAEDVAVLSMRPVGRNVAVTFAYTVVINKDKADLSPDEIERFFTFMPMCGEAALVKNGHCSMEETLEYTHTEEYGWMPRVFVDFRPEMLPLIQGVGASP